MGSRPGSAPDHPADAGVMAATDTQGIDTGFLEYDEVVQMARNMASDSVAA